MTEHAMRVQLDLTGNKITPPVPTPGTDGLAGDAGLILADDVVTVTGVYAPYGQPVDGMVAGFAYVVRVVNASSNSWTRVLLCDFIGQHQVPVVDDDS